MFDIEKVRADFPILTRELNGHPLVYLDNGATTQKPRAVIDSITNFYETTNANIHRGAHGLGNDATALFEQARGAVERFIGAKNGNEVFFTRNTTESLNFVAQAWGRVHLKAGDEILISEMEHHANVVPWHMLAKEKGAALRFLPLTEEGRIDLGRARGFFNARTKIFSLSWVSNVLGVVNPVHELMGMAKAHGSLCVLDAAQAAPHFSMKLRESGADFAAFSAHKMLGPTGVGVLWGREELLDSMEPWQGGGSMIETVTQERVTWNRIPWRFEAGTPNIADVIAFGAAVKYLKSLGWEGIQNHEETLKAAALEKLSSIEGLRLYGPADLKDRVGVFSFNFEGANAQDIGALLDSLGVAIRAGNHCAQPLMARYGCTGMARASFYLYNKIEEVGRLAEALLRVKKILGGGERPKVRAGGRQPVFES